MLLFREIRVFLLLKDKYKVSKRMWILANQSHFIGVSFKTGNKKDF